MPHTEGDESGGENEGWHEEAGGTVLADSLPLFLYDRTSWGGEVRQFPNCHEIEMTMALGRRAREWVGNESLR